MSSDFHSFSWEVSHQILWYSHFLHTFWKCFALASFFKIVSLSFAHNSLSLCLGIYFFLFILIDICWPFWIYKLIFSTKFVNFYFFFQNFLPPCLSPFFLKFRICMLEYFRGLVLLSSGLDNFYWSILSSLVLFLSHVNVSYWTHLANFMDSFLRCFAIFELCTLTLKAFCSQTMHSWGMYLAGKSIRHGFCIVLPFKRLFFFGLFLCFSPYCQPGIWPAFALNFDLFLWFS